MEIQPSTDHTKYYFYNDTTRIIYHSKEYQTDQDLIYLGTSDNPNPKMAAAVFISNGSIKAGFTIKEL